MKWSGDVDLNDGCLQRDYDAYQHRLQQINEIGLSDQGNVTDQLKALLDSLTKDLEFLNSGYIFCCKLL